LGSLSPIIFYAGNEGDIWKFYKNTGYMAKTLAAKWNALVIYGEHRYFGDSIPFSNPDEALKAPKNKYLTVENVMQDYV